MLLRLTPGPAEALFGITAAPMAAVADGHGRVLVSDLNLRGDVRSACSELARALQAFDPRKAANPPYAPPKWAEAFVRPDGAKAMGAFLEQVHPRLGAKPSTRIPFEELKKIYPALEADGALIRFCENYFAACLERAPDPGREHKGHEEESALLEEMTFCRNDGVKFKAIDAYARFAPL
ncbi:MAG: hypothetical protein MUC63_10260, partial [Planctomycetes bacterium]|nr:hypothetical protein [Planctomycetota bacterium]